MQNAKLNAITSQRLNAITSQRLNAITSQRYNHTNVLAHNHLTTTAAIRSAKVRILFRFAKSTGKSIPKSRYLRN